MGQAALLPNSKPYLEQRASVSADYSRITLGLAVAITVLGLAWRVYFELANHAWSFSAITFPDERNYYLSAASEISQSGLAFFLSPRSLWNGPVNPLWIWALGLNVPLIKAGNLLLLALAGLCIWDALRLRVRAWIALSSLALVTFFPPLAVFGPTLLTEAPFFALLAGSGWLLLRRAPLPLTLVTLSGALFGLAILTRPTVQLFPLWLLFLLAGFVVLRRRPIFSARPLIGWLFGAAIFVAPYLAKNYFWLDKLGVANGFGAVLYLGNDLRTDGDEPIYSGRDFDTYQVTAPFTHLDSEGDKRLTQEALRRMAQQPGQIALLTIKKAFRYLFGRARAYYFPHQNIVSFARNESAMRTALTLLDVTTTTVFSVFGVAALLLPVLPIALRLSAFAFVSYMLVLHTVAFPIPRMYVPLIPALAFLAAIALEWMIQQRDKMTLIGTTAVAVLILGWSLGGSSLLGALLGS